MDAFLRRVVELREIEQELAILSGSIDNILRHCVVCDAVMQPYDNRGRGGLQIVPVCRQCGGQKTARRLAKRNKGIKPRRLGLMADVLAWCAGRSRITADAVMSEFSLVRNTASMALSRLAKLDKIERVSLGVYRSVKG